MKIALVQLEAGRDKKKNLSKALYFVHKAIKHHAEFILLPEVFSFRAKINSRTNLRVFVETIPGESLKPLMQIAKENKVFILAGSILEKAKGRNRAYNTSVIIDDKGMIAARYRKMHLFAARLGKKKIREADHFLAGNHPQTCFVKNFKVGLSICYDLRFPDLYRSYGRENVDILTVPSVFTYETGKAHWEVLLRARAIENLSYVLAPNQVGKGSAGVLAYGNSMAVDPWGRVLARGSNNKEEIVYANIKESVIMQQRQILPSVNNKN